MLRITALIDAPVVRLGGVRLGRVRQVLLDQGEGTVLALVLRGPVGPEDAAVVPFEAVYELSPRAAVVVHEDDVVGARRLPRVNAAIERHGPFVRCPLAGPDAAALGHVTDVGFDDTTGAILSYEVAAGPEEGAARVTLPARLVAWRDGCPHVDGRTAEVLCDLLGGGPS